MTVDICSESPSGQLLKAFGEFNRGEWFQCHETLEELWIGTEGEERDFYQGLLQIAVALHHWRNGNFAGCLSLLKGGRGYLGRVTPVCQRMDVAGLIAAAQAMEAALTALGKEGMHSLQPSLVPRLQLVPASDGEK